MPRIPFSYQTQKAPVQQAISQPVQAQRPSIDPAGIGRALETFSNSLMQYYNVSASGELAEKELAFKQERKAQLSEFQPQLVKGVERLQKFQQDMDVLPQYKDFDQDAKLNLYREEAKKVQGELFSPDLPAWIGDEYRASFIETNLNAEQKITLATIQANAHQAVADARNAYDYATVKADEILRDDTVKDKEQALTKYYDDLAKTTDNIAIPSAERADIQKVYNSAKTTAIKKLEALKMKDAVERATIALDTRADQLAKSPQIWDEQGALNAIKEIDDMPITMGMDPSAFNNWKLKRKEEIAGNSAERGLLEANMTGKVSALDNYIKRLEGRKTEGGSTTFKYMQPLDIDKRNTLISQAQSAKTAMINQAKAQQAQAFQVQLEEKITAMTNGDFLTYNSRIAGAKKPPEIDLRQGDLTQQFKVREAHRQVVSAPNFFYDSEIKAFSKLLVESDSEKTRSRMMDILELTPPSTRAYTVSQLQNHLRESNPAHAAAISFYAANKPHIAVTAMKYADTHAGVQSAEIKDSYKTKTEAAYKFMEENGYANFPTKIKRDLATNVALFETYGNDKTAQDKFIGKAVTLPSTSDSFFSWGGGGNVIVPPEVSPDAVKRLAKSVNTGKYKGSTLINYQGGYALVKNNALFVDDKGQPIVYPYAVLVGEGT